MAPVGLMRTSAIVVVVVMVMMVMMARAEAGIDKPVLKAYPTPNLDPKQHCWGLSYCRGRFRSQQFGYALGLLLP